VNIGIVGLGRWGTNYLRTLTELGASVKWVCGRSEVDLTKALKEVDSEARATTNYDDVLTDKETDAVAVVTNAASHYELAKKALMADKHVIVEKPMTLNSKDAEELVKMANERKKVLMVGHTHRFNVAIQKIKEDVTAGLFGNIKYIYSFGANSGPVREDVSALWDFGPHDLTIIAYLLGEYPVSVSANGASFSEKGKEDIFTMDLKFSNNIFAVAVGTCLHPVKERSLVIVGEKMSASFNDYAKANKLKYYTGNSENFPEINEVKPLTEQLRHFLQCVEKNERPYTDGLEGLSVVKVLEAAQKSMEDDGKAVKVKL